MPYSSSPPFIIAEQGVGFALYGVLLRRNGDTIIAHLRGVPGNRECWISKLSVPDEALINSVKVMDKDDLINGNTIYAVQLSETASGNIGILIVGYGSGTPSLGYAAVDGAGNIVTPFGWSALTPGGTLGIALCAANFLTYECVAIYIGASDELRSVVIDEFGNFDADTGIVAPDDAGVFPVDGPSILADLVLAQGSGTLMIASLTRQPVTPGTDYQVWALLFDIASPSVIDAKIADIVEYGETQGYAALSGGGIVQLIYQDLADLYIWRAQQITPLTIAWSIADSVSPMEWSSVNLYNARVAADLSVVTGVGEVTFAPSPSYPITNWQPGTPDFYVPPDANFWYGTFPGLIGTVATDFEEGPLPTDPAYAQIYTVEAPTTRVTRYIATFDIKITPLPCLPCIPVTYNQDSGEWQEV